MQLSGVIIWTNNLKRLRSFYENILNLEPNSIKENFISYKWDDVRLNLGKHSLISYESSKDPYRIMINFNVQNMDLIVSILKKNSVNFIREPEREKWGGIVATFEDPDGNIIQLLEQPR